MKIKDFDFLKTIFGRYCRRRVSCQEDKYALTKLHVELRVERDATLTVSICDNEGWVLEIGWNGYIAWPIRALGVNHFIHRADRVSLTAFIRRFLLKHDLIDNKGQTKLRGVA